ncbi:hypothetical protein F0562_033128 [Nyssa sinensis]|uniref:Uncharacterized protein n=1 Tax=Nyssa sinensis TaxID=561372 RepID=A0A5J5ASN6_9ASTE|nr:hypothetical protein F0562_033128 [Nyssa sinensis]
MKMRNKGKVYPSLPSSSSMSPSFANRDALSVLKLLPAAILALASVLSIEDREVLAYMITRSMKSANPSSMIEEKKNKKKSNTHKPPVFDCECFDCYTSYWFRWDTSPNRELINQAIEAFEEHLANGEQSKRNNKGKKREKMGRRAAEKPGNVSEMPASEIEIDVAEIEDSLIVISPEKAEEAAENRDEVEEVLLVQEVAQPTSAVILRSSAATNHKGLARKVGRQASRNSN